MKKKPLQKRKNYSELFTDVDSLKTIDSIRISYFLVAVTAFFITEVGREVYRPYIYSNDIYDLGIADSIGNLGGIIVQIFFTLAILNSPKSKAYRVIIFLVIGYILYEILQPYLPKGTFDWIDIYATLFGGFIALLIHSLIIKRIKSKVLFKF